MSASVAESFPGLPPAPVSRRTGLPAEHDAPRPRLDSAALRALVHHAGAVEHDVPIEQLHRTFSEEGVEFLALIRDGRVVGLCSRLRLGILLGTRYGFALYSRSPAHLARVEHPLVLNLETPVREVLDRALARPGDEFHEDVALVDGSGALIGLVPIDALARLQSELVAGQVAELQRQHRQLVVAHEALRESRGRYAGLFDSRAMGVALLDPAGAVHAHNQRLGELLNLGLEATTIATLVAWVSEAEREDFRATVAAQAAGAAAVAREYTFDVPGRGARRFRCSLGWIPETRQICACLEDVTEQRSMERQLVRHEKQILLDTLVGGIAHELNNKLTPVQGFSELIRLTADAQSQQYADLIGRSVAEAANIIRQLLQLSKPTPSASETVDLRAIVAEALSMLRFQMRESRCTVRSAAAAAPVWVRADPGQIKQVVINLVLNAVQAMEERTHAELEIETTERGGCAMLVVADNGVGIPAENLERIFDPFFTTKGPERGTGLGLSVCFSIVRQHGGVIEVASEPGCGARFTVSLPLEAAQPAAGPSLVESPVPVTPEPAAAHEARVLVVEDEPQVRRFIQTALLTRFGCEVDTAAHGVEAFERLALHRYALVISDIRMPTMNGTELYLWLREAQPLTARRFVFITGYPGEHHFDAEIAQWQVPVLAKPFTLERLCRTCAPFLEVAAEPSAEPVSA
ncbi:MAG TPA: ATP-binding protein [Opitutaceae bacterium]|nr:ATP-binding protein [Opitutaceae bacterium]